MNECFSNNNTLTQIKLHQIKMQIKLLINIISVLCYALIQYKRFVVQKFDPIWKPLRRKERKWQYIFYIFLKLVNAFKFENWLFMSSTKFLFSQQSSGHFWNFVHMYNKSMLNFAAKMSKAVRCLLTGKRLFLYLQHRNILSQFTASALLSLRKLTKRR